MLDATDSIHEQLKAAAEEIRLAHDNLSDAMFAYAESPTDANRRRIESARREYLIAAEDRESLTERIVELGDWPHTEW